VTRGEREGRVLVTGGTGFIGKVCVRHLLASGYSVRVFARRRPGVDAGGNAGAEIFCGDVTNLDSLEKALEGCDRVVHLAAGTSGGEQEVEAATVQGTRNLLAACRRHRPKRVVYISSCSVYGCGDYPRNARLSETGALERFPEHRGFYSSSKQRAEALVVEAMGSGGLPAVILRPGAVYGPGGELFSAMMGFSIGSLYVVIGAGDAVLPLVHVESLAGAIGLSLSNDEGVGQIFNVVDPGTVTKREWIDRVIRQIDGRARVLYVPYSVVYGTTWLQERVFALARRRPVLTRYRLRSSQRGMIFDSAKISTLLGWAGERSVGERLDELAAFELQRRVPHASGTAAVQSRFSN
jgi:nucleoside-diphosphate-sugar epimerase